MIDINVTIMSGLLGSGLSAAPCTVCSARQEAADLCLCFSVYDLNNGKILTYL